MSLNWPDSLSFRLGRRQTLRSLGLKLVYSVARRNRPCSIHCFPELYENTTSFSRIQKAFQSLSYSTELHTVRRELEALLTSSVLFSASHEIDVLDYLQFSMDLEG